MKIILIDVDSTIADLMPAWLDKYNKDYDDHLTPEDIKTWDLHGFVKPECGKRIYRYLSDPTLYDEVARIPFSKLVMGHLLKNGYGVHYVTAGDPTKTAKNEWLRRQGFFFPGLKKKPGQVQYTMVKDKRTIKGELLVDDRIENVVAYNDKSIIFDQPWNQDLTSHRRAHNWSEALEFIHDTLSKT